MKNQFYFFILIFLLAACNRVNFQPSEMTDQNLGSSFPVDPGFPVDPPDVEPGIPEVPQPAPVRKTGNCPDQQSVTSCLKCEVPAVQPPAPVISTKAQKLAKIMSMACQIPNASYPQNYVAPTAQQVEQHLLACTPELYPETAMSSSQAKTIGTLLDETDESLREKMFKGRWYQPPYTEYFETYFGLDNSEAAYVICMNQGALAPILTTKEYAQAVGSDAGYENWLHNPDAQARWAAAQKQRQELLSCFNKSGSAAPMTPAPTPTTPKTCDYKSFEGLFELGGRQEILNALAEGYKVSMETTVACVLLTDASEVKNVQGLVKIGAYRCR